MSGRHTEGCDLAPKTTPLSGRRWGPDWKRVQGSPGMQEPKAEPENDATVDSMASALRAFIEAFPRRRTMTNEQFEALYSAKCRAKAALGPDGQGGAAKRSIGCRDDGRD